MRSRRPPATAAAPRASGRAARRKDCNCASRPWICHPAAGRHILSLRRRERIHDAEIAQGQAMSREAAIARAEAYFDGGNFKADLARRVAIPTESQNPARAGELERYVAEEMRPVLEALGFTCRILRHEKARGPFLFAERREEEGLPTVLG